MDEATRYLRGSCKTWEKLRIVYTLALPAGIAIHYGFLGKNLAHIFLNLQFDFFVLCLLGFANALYCLGPLFEAVVCVFLDLRIGRFRYVLFGSYLLLSLAGIRVIMH